MKKKVIPILMAILMAFAIMPFSAGTAYAAYYEGHFDDYIDGLQYGKIVMRSTLTVDVGAAIEADPQMKASFSKGGDIAVRLYHPEHPADFDYDNVTQIATLTMPYNFSAYAGNMVYIYIYIGSDIFYRNYDAVAENLMSVVGKTATVKYKKLKKKNQYLDVKKVLAIGNAAGDVSFAKAKGNKKITIDATTGEVTVKKKLKKGKYTITVNVTDAGDQYYSAMTLKKKFNIKVK